MAPPHLRHAEVVGVGIGVLEPLAFRGPDVVHVGVVELRENLLLHGADQGLGESERGLIEAGVVPSCVQRV